MGIAGGIGVAVGSAIAAFIGRFRKSSDEGAGNGDNSKPSNNASGCTPGVDCENLRAERRRIEELQKELERSSESLEDRIKAERERFDERIATMKEENRREFDATWERLGNLEKIGQENLKQIGESNALLREILRELGDRRGRVG